MLRPICLVIATLAATLMAAPAPADPVAADSVVNIIQLENGALAFNGISEAPDFENTLPGPPEISARGSLATGTVGARVLGAESSFSQSIVAVFDTLTFDTGGQTSAEISYTVSFDGTLASDTLTDNPRGQSTVRVFDITGLDDWLETGGLFNTVGAVDGAELLSFARIAFDLDGQPRNGQPVAFDDTATSTFTADPTRLYGIQVSASVFATPGSAADFLNTAAFQFDPLPTGVTFSSGSGVFLTRPVPEPASAVLLAFGALVITRRRR